MNMIQKTPSQSKPQHAASHDWPQGAVPPHWIDSLLTRFEVYYGDKFHRQWANVPRDTMRKQWAIDLAALTKEELAAGVEALKGEEWPPTLPEFLKLCKPEIDIDSALHEACFQIRMRQDGRDEWSNPALFWAAAEIGDFDMLNSDTNRLKKRFGEALKRVMKGEIKPVPPRMIALPAPGKATASKERVEEEVSKIKALQKTEVKNLDWAHRILARVDAGEGMPYAVVKMAKTALGLQ
jgi:hypothetical protein